MQLQQESSTKINKNLIGKKIDCIVEAINENGQIIARTYKDAPEVDCLIYINTTTPVNPGDIISAKITGAVEYDLIGTI